MAQRRKPAPPPEPEPARAGPAQAIDEVRIAPADTEAARLLGDLPALPPREVIEVLMRKTGLSPTGLAAAADVGQPQMSRWQSGQPISPASLAKLAKVIGGHVVVVVVLPK